MEDCPSYGDCQLPCWDCDAFCKFYGKSCWDCDNREGEECGIDGHEVYEESAPCKLFSLTTNS